MKLKGPSRRDVGEKKTAEAVKCRLVITSEGKATRHYRHYIPMISIWMCKTGWIHLSSHTCKVSNHPLFVHTKPWKQWHTQIKTETGRGSMFTTDCFIILLLAFVFSSKYNRLNRGLIFCNYLGTIVSLNDENKTRCEIICCFCLKVSSGM